MAVTIESLGLYYSELSYPDRLIYPHYMGYLLSVNEFYFRYMGI